MTIRPKNSATPPAMVHSASAIVGSVQWKPRLRVRDGGDDESLQQSAGAIEPKVVADQLQRRGARTKQDAIEVAGLDELRAEHVEPATEEIGDREADADETEEHRDVAESPAVDRAEASEQAPRSRPCR